MTRGAVVLVAALLGLGAPGAGAGERASPLTVVAVLDLTGPGASLGQAERIGLGVAEREVAAAGRLGGRLRVVILDSATAAGAAARAARQAIEPERALAIVGGSTGTTAAALADAARRAEIPLLALAEARGAGNPRGDGRWVFQVPPGQALVAEALAQDLERRELRRVAWLEAEGPIGAAGRAAFEPAAARHGLEIVARERVAEGRGDPAAAVTRLLGSAPQAILVWAIPPLAGAVVQPIGDLAPGLPHYQSHAAATGTFLALAGAAVAGVRTVHLKLPLAERLADGDPQRATLLEFLRRARGEAGAARATPSVFAGYGGLDARTLVLVEAVVPPGGTSGEWRPVP